MMAARVPAAYPEEVARVILRALRVGERTIEALLAAPVPALTRGIARPPAKAPSSGA
jgi:hypothetical protein